MIIDFKEVKHQFKTIKINEKERELVRRPKILGVTISDSLEWISHINHVVKKTNKRLYFLIFLKRANVPAKDIGQFYCTCVISVLEYCAPVFYIYVTSLSVFKSVLFQLYLLDHLIRTILWTSTSITSKTSVITYVKLYSKRLCAIMTTSSIISRNSPMYNFRRQRLFNCPYTRTNRFRNSLILTLSNK